MKVEGESFSVSATVKLPCGANILGKLMISIFSFPYNDIGF